MNYNIKNVAIVGYGNIAIKHLKILKTILPNSNIFVISKRLFKKKKKKIIFFSKL